MEFAISSYFKMKKLKDPTERLARQMTGVSLFAGAVYARASQVEFDDEGNAISMKTSFSDMQIGEEGKTLKTGRVAGPLAAPHCIPRSHHSSRVHQPCSTAS